MKHSLVRAFFLVLILLWIGFLLFMMNQVAGLADLANRFVPGAEPYVFWGGCALVFWFTAVPFVLVFRRPRPLRLPENASASQRSEFFRKARKRLRRNPHVRKAELGLRTEEDVELALHHLDEVANEATRKTASRIFLTTAISQNGKLDSFVVFGLLTKLVWDVSGIYSQRASLSGLARVYVNVAVATFLAGGVEELDVQEQIDSILSPVLASSAMGAIPGASGVAAALTAALLDGAANGFLALRVGIITRNHFNYQLDGSSAACRRGAMSEAGTMLVAVTANAAKTITSVYLKSLTHAAGKGFMKAARAVVGTADMTVDATSRAAHASADAVSSGARGVGRFTKAAGRIFRKE